MRLPLPKKTRQEDQRSASGKSNNNGDGSELNVPAYRSATDDSSSRRVHKSVDHNERWREYFDTRMEVEIPTTDGLNDVFNVYIAGDVFNNVLLCFHGGGHSSLSWSLVAGLLKHALCVVAFDFRGHGLTRCQESKKLDNETLVEDGLQIVTKVRDYIDKERKTKQERGETHLDEPIDTMPLRDRILMQSRTDGVPIIFIGHSLGGAIAIQLAATGKVPNLQGLVVLDVVEGTAIEAFPAMKTFIDKFPTSFNSIEEAIEWSLTAVLRNRDSAEVSIPSQLYYDTQKQLWKWRVDLSSTDQYWEGWFKGVSSAFLNCHVGSGGKVLVLVGHDRLDKDLVIAHMQGRYQLQVIPKSGHVVEEDQPQDVANIVLQFASRYRLLPPNTKVSMDGGGEESHPSTATSMFPTGPLFPLSSAPFEFSKK